MGSLLPDSAPADSVINISILLSKFGLYRSVTPYSPDLAPPGIAYSEIETEKSFDLTRLLTFRRYESRPQYITEYKPNKWF